MCIFSGPVKHVYNTRIFARMSSRRAQFLVYSMSYAAERDLAMILPLPVALPAGENSVRFINLKPYPTFFEDMDKGFPQPPPPMSPGGFPGAAGFGGARTLTVHTVGDFVASFVPSLNDFRRLDIRFRLPWETWAQIPAYENFGFAVFQLRKRAEAAGVHPMALEFASRLTDILFLPTVHIHDGLVHPREHFDHALYVQDYRLRPAPTPTPFGSPANVPPLQRLQPSNGVAKYFMDMARAQGILTPNEIAFKRSLIGEYPNQDTVIRCG